MEHITPRRGFLDLQKKIAERQGLEDPGICYFLSAFITHNFFSPEFSPAVLIESMRTKKQAWHVDTPIPHVFVNILYLNSGHSMTQFMVPKSAAGNSFSISLEELLKKPFKPVAKKAEIHAEWTVYIRERYGFVFLLGFLLTIISL